MMFYPFPRIDPSSAKYGRHPDPSGNQANLRGRTHLSDHGSDEDEISQGSQDGESEVVIVLNDDLVSDFAGMEMRRRKADSRRAAHMLNKPSCAHSAALLSEWEEAIGRAAQQDRLREKLRQHRFYGEHIAEVRALEARVNATFDSISHSDSPALWPSVALRHGHG